MPPLDPAGELLLRHRALMFALDAALLLRSLPPGLLRVALLDGTSILLLVTAATCLRPVPEAPN